MQGWSITRTGIVAVDVMPAPLVPDTSCQLTMLVPGVKHTHRWVRLAMVVPDSYAI